MKVIIAGSRTFSDYNLLKTQCDYHLSQYDDIIIVSGCARGADSLGERYAIEKGHSINKFPANWDAYGKAAGFMRNEKMAENSDMLIAFWDGTSKGTKNMINIAKKKDLMVIIVQY